MPTMTSRARDRGCVICCTILMRLSGERIDLFFLVNAGPQRRSRRALHALIDERPDDFDAPLTKIVALCLADLRVAGHCSAVQHTIAICILLLPSSRAALRASINE